MLIVDKERRVFPKYREPIPTKHALTCNTRSEAQSMELQNIIIEQVLTHMTKYGDSVKHALTCNTHSKAQGMDMRNMIIESSTHSYDTRPRSERGFSGEPGFFSILESAYENAIMNLP